MRVLLVTSTEKLVEKMTILNPELKYCALVVNDVESAKDLHYNFQVAKFAVACGANKLRYSLIGLAPYSFHHDLSSTIKFKYMICNILSPSKTCIIFLCLSKSTKIFSVKNILQRKYL